MKDKKLLLKSSIGILILSLTILCTISLNTKAENSDQLIQDNSNEILAEENLNDTLEIIDNKEEIDEKLELNYIEPSYFYNNMKEEKIEGEIESSTINNFEVITKLYKSDDNKEIRIQQAQDTGKPEDLLKTCRKISIKNTDAWIYGESNKDCYAQILFWYNGIYFNISGDIGIDELTNIANSYIKF